MLAAVAMVRQTTEIMRPQQNRVSAKNNHGVAAMLAATREVMAAIVRAEEVLQEVAGMVLVGHKEEVDTEGAVSQKVSSLILE